MKRIRIKHVDAFTDRTFGGNPAGVVPSADGLRNDEMQSIANEMNLSETAFILPSEKADFRLRWFTPRKEIQFCGHATIASLHVLAEEKQFGMNRDGKFSFGVETMVGTLNVEVEKNESSINVILESPPIDLEKETTNNRGLADALNIEESEIESSYPIMREKTLDYLYVALKNLEALKGLSYDYEKLRRYGDKYSIKGFTVLTTETFESGSDVHSRFFTPYYGLREDPTTGSSHGPLAVYLVVNGMTKLDQNNEVEIKAEQGDIMGRPGRMVVRMTRMKNGRYSARIVGRAVTVLDGWLLLP